ncbi:SURF1 family cytochrome oxidase biogenesis protein [Streptomyces sp. NPDC055607]
MRAEQEGGGSEPEAHGSGGSGAGHRGSGGHRFPLTRRWWAVNLFCLLAVPFCLVMGSWQLGLFTDRVAGQREYERARAAWAGSDGRAGAPLEELLPLTRKTSGRAATVVGRYAPDGQFLVPERHLDGREGFYVLTLFRPVRGAAVPVVRGWLPGAAGGTAVPPPPAGQVSVTGVLQPPESRRTPGVRAGGGLPAGRLGLINAASLVNLVPYPVHDAYLTLPRTTEPLRPVPPVPPPGSGLDLKAFQNLGYTGEWFVFAGFTVFMWYRLFRREQEAVRAVAAAAPPGPAPAGAGTGSFGGAMLAAPRTASSAGGDARKDRALEVAGPVLGAALLALIVWSGYDYIAGQAVRGELITYQVVSDESAKARLEVHKGAGTVVVCTVRSLSRAGAEVGRRDVRFAERREFTEDEVTLRTTARATLVELVGCQEAPGQGT